MVRLVVMEMLWSKRGKDGKWRFVPFKKTGSYTDIQKAFKELETHDSLIRVPDLDDHIPGPDEGKAFMKYDYKGRIAGLLAVWTEEILEDDNE